LIQLYISAKKMEKMERDDQSIEIFRMKRLFKRLETAKVSGSVITVIIPPRKNVSDVTKLLAEEQGKAVNIKDRTNRNSVVEAQIAAR